MRKVSIHFILQYILIFVKKSVLSPLLFLLTYLLKTYGLYKQQTFIPAPLTNKAAPPSDIWSCLLVTYFISCLYVARRVQCRIVNHSAVGGPLPKIYVETENFPTFLNSEVLALNGLSYLCFDCCCLTDTLV